jgi:valyl-tRNA synthetase
MTQAYPCVEEKFINDTATQSIDLIKTLIVALRTLRSEMNVAPSKQITLLADKATPSQRAIIETNMPLICSLAKLESITWLEGTAPPAAATALANEMELFIPLAGLIDVGAETERLQKEIGKLEKDVLRSSKKLDNESYVKKAPAEVVAQEREKLVQNQAAVQKLQTQLLKLADL